MNKTSRELRLEIEKKVEEIQELSNNLFSNGITSFLRSIYEDEIGEYMKDTLAISSKRFSVASDLLTYLRNLEAETTEMIALGSVTEEEFEEQTVAYSVILENIGSQLFELRDKLRDSDKALNEECAKVNAIIGKSSVGFKYFSGRFEALESKNESLWEDVCDLKDWAYGLEEEISCKREKLVKKAQAEAGESEPNA